MTLKLEKRFSNGLTFLSAYTWSKTLDNVDENLNNAGGGAGLKPWDRNLNRGRSLTDVRHNYVFSSNYELPIFKGNRILGGWQVGGILSLRSGLPFTVGTSGGITNAGGADRPNRIGSGISSSPTIDRWFNISDFVVQPNFTYGNSGRNILSGPWLRNIDFSLAKTFGITDRFRLQFRAEAFNATNTANFGLPAANISTPQNVGTINSADEPRRVQMGLKLLF